MTGVLGVFLRPCEHLNTVHVRAEDLFKILRNITHNTERAREISKASHRPPCYILYHDSNTVIGQVFLWSGRLVSVVELFQLAKKVFSPKV